MPIDKIFQCQASIGTVSTTKDRGVRFSVITQELPEEQVSALLRLRDIFGWFCFKMNDFQPDDIPKEQAEFKGKTQSTRIRDILFLLHKQNGGKDDAFVDYYKVETEKYITHLKSKIIQPDNNW